MKRKKHEKSVSTERLLTYDRDIICLPKSFVGDGGLIKIPRQQHLRDFLATNGLYGKIRLTSAMSEDEIMDEIRSVMVTRYSGLRYCNLLEEVVNL